MRIIGGKFKGRKITTPAKLEARPTTDFAREGLFSTLGNMIDFEGLAVLDLFAGTGSVGLEFLSRGARDVTFVDNNALHCRHIRKVLTELDAEEAEVVTADAFSLLQKPFSQYDLVFADPPYGHPRLGELPDLILGRGHLAPEGLFILEHGKEHDFSAHQAFLKAKKYGHVHFAIFEKEG